MIRVCCFRTLVVSVLFLAVVGCGGPASQSAEQLEAAQTAVKTSLDAWKAGQPAAKWDKDSAAVRFVDDDWRLGAAIIEYKLTKAEGAVGENTRCWTILSLRDRKDRVKEKEIVYSVKPGSPRSLRAIRSIDPLQRNIASIATIVAARIVRQIGRHLLFEIIRVLAESSARDSAAFFQCRK